MPATLAHAFDTVRAIAFREVLSERRLAKGRDSRTHRRVIYRRAFQTQRFLRLTIQRERGDRFRRCDIVSEVGLLETPLMLG